MKQNNKENVLCIGEIIIFIATTYLLLNSSFLSNITRVIVSGVVSFFFIILSDHVKKEFNYDKGSMLSWILGIAEIIIMFYGVGKFGLIGQDFSTFGKYSQLFYTALTMLTMLMAIVSKYRYKNNLFTHIIYLSILALIYIAGMVVKLNAGYIAVIIMSILMLINIIKKEGNLYTFSRNASLICIILTLWFYQKIDIEILCLSYIVNSISLFSIKRKEKENYKKYLSAIINFAYLYIIIERGVSSINLVYIAATGALVDVIYNVTKVKEGKLATVNNAIYNLFYLYLFTQISTSALINSIPIILIIFINSIGKIFLNNQCEHEKYLLPIKLYLSTSILLNIANGMTININDLYVNMIINIILLAVLVIFKNKKINYIALGIMLVNTIPLLTNEIEIIQALPLTVLMIISYLVLNKKCGTTEMKKMLISILFLTITYQIVNNIDFTNIKYLILAIVSLLMMTKTKEKEYFYTLLLIIFEISTIKYLNILMFDLLALILKEIVIFIGVYLFITNVIKDKDSKETWKNISLIAILVLNLFITDFYLISLLVALMVYLYMNMNKMSGEKVSLAFIILYLLLVIKTTSIPFEIIIIGIGLALIAYVIKNKDKLKTPVSKIEEVIKDAEETDMPKEKTEVKPIDISAINFCTRCGKKVEQDELFCGYCGEKIKRHE